MPSEAPAGGVSLEEVNDALGQWEIGSVREIAPLTGGSRANPKMRIHSERGAFVLKRRPVQQTDLERIRFAHHALGTVAAAGLPVALPQPARDRSTFQVRPHGIYELFNFLGGERWKRSELQAYEAGRALSRLHRAALEMQWHGHVKASCYHGNLVVVEALRRVPEAILAAQPETPQQPLIDQCQKLSSLYQVASEKVDELEYQALDSQVVHGDWHPGNILFAGDEVTGVLDFDSARLEPAIADVANGLLQHSVRAGPRRAVAQWPHEIDEALFFGFARGIASADSGSLLKFVKMVPWLMIEACIAEAAIPIAKTGIFATIPGDQMLSLILRRASWIQGQAAMLSKRLALEIKV
ncbi:MAG: phosphotransferase [Planctomycetes bacterium]|nr:phosphotransferase [Planctomycetota bacterium]